MQRWSIDGLEYDDRVGAVRSELERRQLDGLVLFHPIRMAWVSGFFHLSTERPMAIVIRRDGGMGGLIPHLEVGHFSKARGITHTEVYPEYPTGGGRHPMAHFGELLSAMKLNGKGIRLGYDNNGYLDINGYDGPLLSDVVGDQVACVPARDVIDRLRAVKSDSELRLISESCVWGNLAHRLMHDAIAEARGAMEVWLEASHKASQMMVASLGPDYQPMTTAFGLPALANFTAGSTTSDPHALSSAMALRKGDLLVTYSGADVGGYVSELERTMFLGDPGKDGANHFESMLLLQQVAFDAIRPGRTFAEVEAEVREAFTELKLIDYQRHHTGHGIGLEGHEWPFIDLGSEDVIEERMVLSVEPGFYIPGVGGFRHSDTVVVRSAGVERLTWYPRDLERLTVKA